MGGAALRERRKKLLLSGVLPEGTAGARVTMMGRCAVLVEGQRGVLELGRQRIRLKTHDGVLSISGCNLRLQELTLDSAMIRGDHVDQAAYAGAD